MKNIHGMTTSLAVLQIGADLEFFDCQTYDVIRKVML